MQGATAVNQLVIVDPKRPDFFGHTVTMDWVIRDDLGPKANVVAAAKGQHMRAGDVVWFTCFTILFSDDRFEFILHFPCSLSFFVPPVFAILLDESV